MIDFLLFAMVFQATTTTTKKKEKEKKM